MRMVGEAYLPSNAYYPRASDYTFYSGVHVCWSEHSDSSFVYGFMSLDYGLGTLTATTFRIMHANTKTCLNNFDPIKLHFYILKPGFPGLYIDFLISAQTHSLWVLIRTASARRF